MPVLDGAMLMGVISLLRRGQGGGRQGRIFENKMLKAYIAIGRKRRGRPALLRREGDADQGGDNRRFEAPAGCPGWTALVRLPSSWGSNQRHDHVRQHLRQLFCVTNFGESHGPAIGCVIGMAARPGLPSGEADIQFRLDRRRPAPAGVTQRNEPDAGGDPLGVYEGSDHRHADLPADPQHRPAQQDYGNLLDTFRPGHADCTYWRKYGLRDPRREGARRPCLTRRWWPLARWPNGWPSSHGTWFIGWMSALDDIAIAFTIEAEIARNAFFAPDVSLIAAAGGRMDACARPATPAARASRCAPGTYRSGWVSRCTTSSTPTSPSR